MSSDATSDLDEQARANMAAAADRRHDPGARLSPETAASECIQLLHERPRTGSELATDDGTNSTFSALQRDLVCRLHSPNRGGAPQQYGGYGKAYTVYYLWGDDRRGVRRFIDVNEAFVRRAMADEPNGPFAAAWDDALYGLLVEEWQLREFAADGEGGGGGS